MIMIRAIKLQQVHCRNLEQHEESAMTRRLVWIAAGVSVGDRLGNGDGEPTRALPSSPVTDP
jgi:hypothetical protein